MKLEEEVGELLKSKNLSLSTAESCTGGGDRKSTRLNSSHTRPSRMPSSA